jgi:hypothetical protein
MSAANGDPLRSRLREVENEIRGRVRVVCGTPPPEDLDTGAMIRFEEALSIVTSAAKEAVSLRRRLRLDQRFDELEPRPHERSPDPDAGREHRPEPPG